MERERKRLKVTFRLSTVTMIMLLIAVVGMLVCVENALSSTKIIFGALLDFTGDRSSLGESIQVALNPAFKDIESCFPELRILVVHSYHKEWGWDQDIQRGIVEGLYRQGYRQKKIMR